MQFKTSKPAFNLTDSESFEFVDGWLGLKSAKKTNESTYDNSHNFMDQLIANKMIEEDNKQFSIYIAEDSDASYSSILFGGHDEEGFNDPKNTIELQTDENYAISVKKFQFGDDIVKDLNNGQKAIFDPSYPFIYMGEADFLAFAGKAKTIWPTAF